MKRMIGFTLIELIVVMALIAVLVTIVLIAVNPVENTARARDAGKKSSIHQIGNAIQAFRVGSNGQFPSDSNWDQDLLSKSELTVLPSNPSSLAGCDTNLKPGPTTGWCYTTYVDTASSSIHALLYAILDAKVDKSKCNESGGEVAYYVWASINGGSGVYCMEGSDIASSFNDHKNFVGD